MIRLAFLFSYPMTSFYTLAALPLRTIMCAFLLVFGCLGSLVNPISGVVLYMMIYQITPNTRWWGEPLAELGIRFSMMAAMFTILGLAVAPHKIPKVKPWLSPWEGCIILMILLAAANNYVFGLPTTPKGVIALEKFWKMLMFVLVLNRLASNRSNLKIMLWSLVVGSLYLGYDAFTASPDAYTSGRLKGIGGPDFQNSSSFAAHMAAMLPLIGMMFMVTKSWKAKALAVVSAVLTANAIVASRTRSAFVGILAGAFVAVIAVPKQRRVRILGLLAVGGFASLYVTDDYFWRRMQTMTQTNVVETDLATKHRFEIWHASYLLLSDYPFGIGMSNFPYIIGKYDITHANRTTHNTLLTCFTELGIQGGLLFMIMCLIQGRMLIRCVRMAPFSESPVETKLLAYGALVSWVTYFVAGLGTERFYAESFWWVFAMPQWLDRTVRSEVEAQLPTLADAENMPYDALAKTEVDPYYDEPEPTTPYTLPTHF